jgi:hypothetical protein
MMLKKQIEIVFCPVKTFTFPCRAVYSRRYTSAKHFGTVCHATNGLEMFCRQVDAAVNAVATA